jgi:protein transport protein SEC13
LWRNTEADGHAWNLVSELEGKDWIRDVAFEPTTGALLAAVSQDKVLRVMKVNPESGIDMSSIATTNLDDVGWRASWSPQGAVVAVTTADNKVTLYRQSQDTSTASWLAVNTFPLS